MHEPARHDPTSQDNQDKSSGESSLSLANGPDHHLVARLQAAVSQVAALKETVEAQALQITEKDAEIQRLQEQLAMHSL